MSRFPALVLPVLVACLPAAAAADVTADIRRCGALTDDSARLACFDEVAAGLDGGATDAISAQALAALDREFRFDRSTRVAPTMFRLEVSKYLSLSRETGPGRDVQRLATRINQAIGNLPGWSLDIVVHGASVELPRARPLSGAELLDQATRAMLGSGVPEDRYAIAIGPDAEPLLWDDGRVRGSNEHITVEVSGL